MNSPYPAPLKTLSLRDAVAEKINALSVNQTITVKEITESLRRDINANKLTLIGVDLNSTLIGQFWLPDGSFERQTVKYEDVRNTFLSVIDSMYDLSWKLDSTNTFRIYRKDPDPTVTGRTPSMPNIQTFTGGQQASVLVNNPTPAPTYVAPRTKTLAERVLDGSVTHKFNVILNGTVLKFNKQSTFFSKLEATRAVEAKLAVLELTPKALAKEIRSLEREGILRFTRTKV